MHMHISFQRIFLKCRKSIYSHKHFPILIFSVTKKHFFFQRNFTKSKKCKLLRKFIVQLKQLFIINKNLI